ncbi:NAD-dependent epimerase/dehydratase family protein [Sphingobacterium thalpophilum]|uniref:UDP-glucose 4-epimerase n=1 Tax=Sphingobacterium thalpophilum TaxID=259 RepID=A0A4U9URM1_9SPHI|nr:NAD-dependent epimerase/dehydratase family protein [Sphingobacterium thalpophilum]VTR34879.1 UDP-glucose 4-epimerase [Sphingobacterium thalpophilum]
MKMNIKVLGGTGMIGRNLIESLNSEDNLNLSVLSLRDEKWKSNFDKDCDIVINLIGKAHDHDGLSDQKDYYQVNVELIKEVFTAFLSSNASLMIHISSLAALEEFEANIPLTEKDKCNPVSWYGKSKLEAEKWLLKQKIPSDKKLIILRPPMVHGPGDKGNLGLLYKLISKGIPYPLSSFDNSRSFISITNFSFFIKKIIGNSDKLKTDIYHIADDESISTSEIVEIIKESTGKNVLNLPIPKFLIRIIAKIGDTVPIPLNTKRLKKMTSNLLVSNAKIKTLLQIDKLPLTARDGIKDTISTFSKS